MLSCHEATRLVSKARDRPLATNECLALRTHLWICKGCRNLEENLRSLRVIARTFVRSRQSGPQNLPVPVTGPNYNPSVIN